MSFIFVNKLLKVFMWVSDIHEPAVISTVPDDYHHHQQHLQEYIIVQQGTVFHMIFNNFFHLLNYINDYF